MSKKSHMLLIIGITALFSCKSPQEIIVKKDYTFHDNSSIKITSHKITEDKLTLEIEYIGCKKDTIILIGNGVIKKSNPPKINLELLNQKPSNCNEEIKKIVVYNLSSIKYNDTEEKNTLNLYINNSETSVEYVY